MKRGILYFLLVLFIGAGSTGCKKQIEQIKSDALTDYLSANKWAVQQYTEGTTDVTAEFESYEFIFAKDNTVTGTKAGTTTTYSGTWSSSVSAVTMTALFATGTPRPVSLLNGTWGVSSYNSTATTFSQTINGVEMKLILRKK